jgi:hypothetical protein
MSAVIGWHLRVPGAAVRGPWVRGGARGGARR